MKSQGPDAPQKGSDKPLAFQKRGFIAGVSEFVTKTLVIVNIEIHKLRRDPSELLMRAVQPILWLVIFGSVFTKVRAIPTGDLKYLDFLAPGILAQSVLFVAIFYGISIILDRDLGVIHKFMVSPTPRTALVLGKALSAGVRGLCQTVIIYIVALIAGVSLDFHPLKIAGVLLVVLFGAVIFSTFSLIIACLVKTRERFMGIGQLMTMPLFFASNAIYPISIMPSWLQVVSSFNPLTYQVDALRALMLDNGASIYGIGQDIGVLSLVTIFVVFIAGKLYRRIIT
ncbi:MAG: ABC transporter permease [Planctomycetes bacterium]|nr:ABC transporter permease [Planctomycetota bacterium]